ncbi:MAG: DUF4245 family protein [Nocardioides sp.]|uniref:DUF4245 family protein n=1 Tax=Nocardioides sp. TaxID=35761 RepID=UPI003F0A1141
MSEKSGRYERSFGGLIGAMVITVAAVLGFLVWKDTFSGDAEQETVPVEWSESVKLAQDAGMRVAHPNELPTGWIATSVDLVAVGETRWGMGLLTDDEDFVGLRQQDKALSEMVKTYIDKSAEQGEDVEIDSDVATAWQVWTDEGGDTGYSAEVGDEVLLVYGSAPAEEIVAFIESLTL